LRPPTWDDRRRHTGPIQRRDARAKLIAALFFLICVGISNEFVSLIVLAAVVALGICVERLPLLPFTRRVLTILPIPGIFAAVVWMSGHPHRAGILFTRSLLSVTAILFTVTCTPPPKFLAALTWAKVPPLLVEVLQFVYRYLFVLAEEVWTLRQAAASRAGSGSIVAAASGVTVLFARSYARAEAIHRAMLSRSFSGLLTTPLESRPDVYDFAFVAATACLSACGVASSTVI
jgi:cobalt/nickel transport system permease protein